jgi:hypothetical protein
MAKENMNNSELWKHVRWFVGALAILKMTQIGLKYYNKNNSQSA